MIKMKIQPASFDTQELRARLGLFGNHDLDALQTIQQSAAIVRLKRGQPLKLSGEEGRLVYIVRSGFLAVTASLVTDRRLVLSLLFPAGILRPATLPRLAQSSVVATMNSIVLKLGEVTLREMARQSGAVQALLDAAAVTQLMRDKLQIALLSGATGEERVASFLAEIAYRLGRPHGTGAIIEIPLSRTDIAQYLALNPDTLSRIFSRFKAQGVIRFENRRRVEITDLAALAERDPIGWLRSPALGHMPAKAGGWG
jgi:CRP/FNR family transcriptional regulator, anaerobic regulatory protein